MEKLTLTKVFRATTNRDGTPLVSKNGKPYTRLLLKAEKYGDKWISGFGNSSNASWKDGDTVEVQVTQNGDYLNFETPKREDKIEARLKKLEDAVFGGAKTTAPKAADDDKLPDYPELDEGFPFDDNE